MQKENLFFFSFPSASNFGEAKVTKKREQNKIKSFIFYAETEYLRQFIGKVHAQASVPAGQATKKK